MPLGTAEVGYINAAITQFMSDMQGCITFVAVLPTDARFKLAISPYNASA